MSGRMENTTMKIIHLLSGIPAPRRMNGVYRVAHSLAREQCRLGHDVELWGFSSAQQEFAFSENYRIDIFPASRLRFFASCQLFQAVIRLPAQTIVHFHSVFIPEFYAASRIFRKKDIPWILSPHGGYSPRSLKKHYMLKRLYMILCEMSLLKQAKAIHAVGASEVADTQKICPSAKIALIPNGQYLHHMQAHAPPEVGPHGGRPVFGYCGRLETRHKGLDILLEGFARYLRRSGRGKLWIIGDGTGRKGLKKKAAELGILQQVKFWGALFGKMKESCLSHMDIFVHTSRWEGMPLAVLEAASFSKPLLISEATNLSELVQQYACGIVLKENTPVAIASAMETYERLYHQKAHTRIGRQALEMVTQECNWPRITRRLIHELYR